METHLQGDLRTINPQPVVALPARWVLMLWSLALLLSGCASAPESETAAARVRASATPEATAMVKTRASAPSAIRETQRKLVRLPRVDRVTPTELGYNRDAFGSSWLDLDRNGCNQRDDVLLRDALPGTVVVERQGACDHDVIAGAWLDPYTNTRLEFTDLKDLSQAQAIQIDHVVPLAEAWVSGAARWSEDRRRAFANDLPGLLAVDGPTNASKSDDDPAAWRPTKSYQCAYAKRWVRVKSAWRLGADRSERRALREMLGYCRE